MNEYDDDFKNILQKYVDTDKIENIIESETISKELEIRFELDFSVNEILDVIRSEQKYEIEKEISIVEYHNEEDYLNSTNRKIIYEYPKSKVVTETKRNISSDKFNIQGFPFKISYSVENIQEIKLLEVPKIIRQRERYIIKNFVEDKYELHLTIVKNLYGIIENKIEIEYSTDKIKSVDDFNVPIKELFDKLYVKSFKLLRNSEMINITNEVNEYLMYMKGPSPTDRDRDNNDKKNGILIKYEDKPISLKREDIKNVRSSNYYVTNKLNGTRYYLYISKGIFYLVGRTGSKLTSENKIYTFVWNIHETLIKTNYVFILDGEYFFNRFKVKDQVITKLYYVFDILLAKYGNEIKHLHKYFYSQRYDYIKANKETIIKDAPVEIKDVIKDGSKTIDIIKVMKTKFGKLWDYKNDGLIYTSKSNVYGIEGAKTLKWKFDHHQSVDIKVKKYVKGAVINIKSIKSIKEDLSKEASDEDIKSILLKDFFYEDENADLENLKLTKESVYSVTPWKEADVVSKEIVKRLNMKPKDIIITDATANVGGNTLSFYRNKMSKINSFEIDTLTCEFLKNNLRMYRYITDNVFCENYLNRYMDIAQDVIFFDPPWGGPDYFKKKNLNLYLGDTNIKYIIKNLLDYDKAKLVVVKVPFNFAFKDLEEYLCIYKIDKVPVYRYKKGKNEVSYYILYIENTYLKSFFYDCYVKGDNNRDIKFKNYPLYSTEELKEESIIEVSFDRSTKMFYKLRSRPDKLNPNYIKVAEDFWDDINNPIPITDLSKIELNIRDKKTNEDGTFDDWNQYRTYSKNKKKEVIEAYIDKNSIVIDVGFGKGGDISRYMKHDIRNIIGIEPDNKNIDEYLVRYKGKFTIVSNPSSENSNVYNLNINGKIVEILLINSSASDESIIQIIKDYLEDKKERPVVVSMFFSLTYFFGPDDSFVKLINIMMEFNPRKILGAVMDGERTKEFIHNYEWNEEKCGFKLKLIKDNVIDIEIKDSATVTGHHEFLTDFSRLNDFLTYYNFKLENRTFYNLNLGETNLLTYFSALNYTFVFEMTTTSDISVNNLIRNIVRYNDNLSIRLDARYFYNCIMGQKKNFNLEELNNKVLNGIFKNQLVNYEKIDKNKEEKSSLDIKRFYNLTGRVNNSFILTYEVPMDTTLKNLIFYNNTKFPFKITNIMYDYYNNKEENDAYKIFEIIKSSLPVTREYSLVEYNIGSGNYTMMFVYLFKNIICVDNLPLNLELARDNIVLWHKKPITNIPIKFIEKSKYDNINDILKLSSDFKNVLFVNYIYNIHKQPNLKEIKEVANVNIIIILSENNIFDLVQYFNNFNFYKLTNSYLYVIYIEPIFEKIIELKEYEEGRQIVELKEYKAPEKLNINSLYNNEKFKNDLLSVLNKNLKFVNIKENEITDILEKNKSDNDILLKLNELNFKKNPIKKETKKSDIIRGKSRVKEIEKLLKENNVELIVDKDSKYLDVGSSNGVIAKTIGNSLGFKSENIYGIEISKWAEKEHKENKPSIQTEYIDGKQFPFEDNSFNLISCIMSIHHFEYKNDMLNEIQRVLKPNGVLIIREHEFDGSDELRSLIDLEHAIYANVLDKQNTNKEDINKFWSTYIGDYFSFEELKNYLSVRGINSITKNIIAPSGTTKYYWSVFQKPNYIIEEEGAEERKEERKEEPVKFSKGDYVLFTRNDPKLLEEFGVDLLVGKIVNDKPDMFGRYDVKIKDSDNAPLAFIPEDMMLITEEQYEYPEIYDEIVIYKRKPVVIPSFENYDIEELLTKLQNS